MTNDQEKHFWLGVMVMFVGAIAVVLLSGCASNPSYSATVQVEADGEREVVVGKLQLLGGT